MGLARKRAGMRLTGREAAYLGLAARGYSNREIGRRLGVRESTVKNGMSLIYVKLSAPDRTAAVVIAIAEGEIGMPEVGEVVRLERG